MKLNLPASVTSRFSKQALVVQAHSPKILFVSGLALLGGTVVSACYGTLKLEGVLEDIRADRDDMLRVTAENPDRYGENEVTKLNVYITTRGIARITKLYLPSLALGVAAVACLTASHNQLSRRNAGLSAALAATERALDSYRSRVRAEYGDEKELQIWRDERTVETPVLDDEGRQTKSTKKTRIGGGTSPYARMWGRDTSSEWSPHPEYNLAKLRAVQEYATIKLNSSGHVFLNEVLDELGLSRSPEGAVVGWIKKEHGGGDGYVDFGIFVEGSEIQFVDFLTGDEDHIVLDFNVDGEIWRKI